MPRSSAKLRVVAGRAVYAQSAETVGDSPEQAARDPEQELARLFGIEQDLERELLKVRNEQRFQRGRYAEKHGLCASPRMELLRTRFGTSQ